MHTLRLFDKKSPDFGQGQYFFMEVARFKPSFLTFLKIMLDFNMQLGSQQNQGLNEMVKKLEFRGSLT